MLFPTSHRHSYEIERHEYGYEAQHTGVYFLTDEEANKVRKLFIMLANKHTKNGIKHLIYEIRPARIGGYNDVLEFFEIKPLRK